MSLKVLIAAGGTGGHLYPGLAVLDALRDLTSVEPLFVGTSRGIEARVVPGLGHPLALLDVAPVNRVGARALVRALAKLPRAASEAARIVREFGPDVVLSVGGYAAGPVAVVGIARRVPVAVIEPNAIPGMTHRWVGPFVARAYLAHGEAARYFRTEVVRVYGSPVRRTFLAQAAGARALGRKDSRAHVLVLGGSQGARALNRVMPGAVQWAHDAGAEFSVVHQTGLNDRESVANEYGARCVRADVLSFIDDVAAEMERADLVVCRAGMGSIAELCVMGRPAVFIPLPSAADDHQRKNAEAVAARGAGVYLAQSELTEQSLGQKLAELLSDRETLGAMGERARSLGRPDAADRIAQDLLGIAKQ